MYGSRAAESKAFHLPDEDGLIAFDDGEVEDMPTFIEEEDMPAPWYRCPVALQPTFKNIGTSVTHSFFMPNCAFCSLMRSSAADCGVIVAITNVW